MVSCLPDTKELNISGLHSHWLYVSGLDLVSIVNTEER